MSTSKTIEAEIYNLEATVKPSLTTLDAKVQEFAAELPAVAAAWLKEEVKRRIGYHADQINEAGVEAVRNLKNDLDQLIGQLPDICSNAVGKPEEWPHNKSTNKTDTYRNTNSREEYFAAVFRKAINPLGTILSKYDLIKERKGYVPSWERATDGSFRFAISPGFDARKFPSLMEYSALLKEHQSRQKELDLLRQNLAKARASELWDAA